MMLLSIRKICGLFWNCKYRNSLNPFFRLIIFFFIFRVEGGELFDRVIDDDYILTEKACVIILRQLCQAMEFVHRNNIVHLDLKPENILLLTKEGNRIKIIDFGLARKYDPDKKLQVSAIELYIGGTCHINCLLKIFIFHKSKILFVNKFILFLNRNTNSKQNLKGNKLQQIKPFIKKELGW